MGLNIFIYEIYENFWINLKEKYKMLIGQCGVLNKALVNIILFISFLSSFLI